MIGKTGMQPGFGVIVKIKTLPADTKNDQGNNQQFQTVDTKDILFIKPAYKNNLGKNPLSSVSVIEFRDKTIPALKVSESYSELSERCQNADFGMFGKV